VCLPPERSAGGWCRANGCRETLGPLVQRIVTKAQQQGTLRRDVAAEDITYVQFALGAVIDASRGTSPELYRNHLKLFLDGMRTESSGAGTSVPV
jgi:hypothetical protein